MTVNLADGGVTLQMSSRMVGTNGKGFLNEIDGGWGPRARKALTSCDRWHSKNLQKGSGGWRQRKRLDTSEPGSFRKHEKGVPQSATFRPVQSPVREQQHSRIADVAALLRSAPIWVF